jgi:hypothetical protein
MFYTGRDKLAARETFDPTCDFGTKITFRNSKHWFG